MTARSGSFRARRGSSTSGRAESAAAEARLRARVDDLPVSPVATLVPSPSVASGGAPGPAARRGRSKLKSEHAKSRRKSRGLTCLWWSEWPGTAKIQAQDAAEATSVAQASRSRRAAAPARAMHPRARGPSPGSPAARGRSAPSAARTRRAAPLRQPGHAGLSRLPATPSWPRTASPKPEEARDLQEVDTEGRCEARAR